jgi:hypothetical protein
MRQAPAIVSSHIVAVLALASWSGCAAIACSDPAIGPLAALKKPAADHDGAVSLLSPS